MSLQLAERVCLAMAAALILSACQSAPRSLHERVIVLDTHLDTPRHFGRPGWNLGDRHSLHDDPSQVDYPRMVDGGLDGGFWAIFSVQRELTSEGYAKAREHALKRAAQIHQAVNDNPRTFEFVTTTEEAERAVRRGKRVAFMSIENAYPLGTDPLDIRTFYDLGVRMVGLVHSADNQFADSATDQRQTWKGLSSAGVKLVREANRLGMVIDASHASDAAFDQMLAISKAPILLSHSDCREVYEHPRNIDDARLRTLAAAGGVIQINSVGSFLTKLPASPERDAAMKPLREKYGWPDGLSREQGAEYAAARNAVDARFPPVRATLEDFMKHLLHAIDVAGVEHVGIGMDWDGGGGVQDLEDASKLPVITARLRDAGYSDRDIAAIMGGNALRVVRAAAAAAKQAQP